MVVLEGGAVSYERGTPGRFEGGRPVEHVEVFEESGPQVVHRHHLDLL